MTTTRSGQSTTTSTATSSLPETSTATSTQSSSPPTAQRQPLEERYAPLRATSATPLARTRTPRPALLGLHHPHPLCLMTAPMISTSQSCPRRRFHHRSPSRLILLTKCDRPCFDRVGRSRASATRSRPTPSTVTVAPCTRRDRDRHPAGGYQRAV